MRKDKFKNSSFEKNFKFFNMKILFYNSYIMSTFDFCCTVWGTGKRSESIITKLQNRTAKVILQQHYKPHANSVFTKLEWLPFRKRYNYHMGLMIYKSINGDAPKYISNLLQFCENNNYNLRSTERKDLRMANIKIIPTI